MILNYNGVSWYLLILEVAAITWAILFPTRWVLHRLRVVDCPNTRSSHQMPIVRGGGIAIVLMMPIAIALCAFQGARTELSWLFSAFVGLGVVSFVDDIRGLKPALRFLVQGVAAAAVVMVLLVPSDNGSSLAKLAFGCVAWLWIAGYTNAFNFMDGINGIAGFQALITGIGTAAIAVAAGLPATHPAVVLVLVLSGAAGGFLPHNFPRASVFMGDVGSASLGFLLAVFAFWISQATHWWMIFWIGLLHANFVLDTGITVVRRALRRDRLHEAHREHFYQRLVRAGYSHAQVTLAESGLQMLVAVALSCTTPADWKVKIVVGTAVVAVWFGFFAFAEKKFMATTGGERE